MLLINSPPTNLENQELDFDTYICNKVRVKQDVGQTLRLGWFLAL